MSYDEHLISMAGGDGDRLDLDAIQARAQINKYLGKTASQDEAKDTLALLAMVREQRAILDAIRGIATRLDASPQVEDHEIAQDLRAALDAS